MYEPPKTLDTWHKEQAVRLLRVLQSGDFPEQDRMPLFNTIWNHLRELGTPIYGKQVNTLNDMLAGEKGIGIEINFTKV